MTAGNPVLAAILDRGGAAAEADQLLAALVDVGVLVPVNAAGAVVFVQDRDGRPVLATYASEQACLAALPHARPILCDALRLMDIAQTTGVTQMIVASTDEWAKVPLALIAQTLQHRGLRTQYDQRVRLTRTAHPLALALRDGLSERLLDFPGVEAVWIANARWMTTGQEQLILHLLLCEGTDLQIRDQLMNALLTDHNPRREGDPTIAVRVLDAGTDTAAIAEIDAMGLDTVRADHAARRITVLSVDYDKSSPDP